MKKLLLWIIVLHACALVSTKNETASEDDDDDDDEIVKVPERIKQKGRLEQICTRPYANQIPQEDLNVPVVVKFETVLWGMDLQEREELIDIRVYIEMTWMSHLKFNASKYGGEDEVECLPTQIWMPDVHLLGDEGENAKYASTLTKKDRPVVLSSDGRVKVMEFYRFKTSCDLELFSFPYDNQTCTIKFASWKFESKELLLKSNYEQVKRPIPVDYNSNGIWKLDGIALTSQVTQREGRKMSELHLTLTVSRKSRVFTVNVIIPCLILSCLSLVVFLLPEESGEKVGLCITILLALTVFQQLTADSLPEHGIPYVSIFYLIVMIFNAVALVVTTMTLSFYYARSEAPRWLRVVLVDGLGRVLCVRNGRKTPRGMTVAPSDIELVGEDKNAGQAGEEEAAREDGDKEEDKVNSWLDINSVLNRFFFIVLLVGLFAAFLYFVVGL